MFFNKNRMDYINMKEFNKDKYLKKLRFKKYKRYLYIGIPCMLVLLIGIYFAYSKFSVFKEEEVVRTTVGDFISEDDVIGAYIDGEYSTTIPGKNDGYVVDKIVCDNNASASWNNDSWGIVLTNLTKRTKCNVYFKKQPSLTEVITTALSNSPSMFASDDPGKNVRYIGANPNNYVYFNCSDYNNPTADTCELWRIIGVFNNVTKAVGYKENLVKIIRDDSLGNYYWDYKKDGVGSSIIIKNLNNKNNNYKVAFLDLKVENTQNSFYNDYKLENLAGVAGENYGSSDWTDSQLMMMLNPVDYLKDGYTNENDILLDSNGQQIYSKMGSYYNGTKGCKPASIAIGASFSCTEADFTSTGLKNDTTRNAIEEVVWNLGGTGSYTSASNGLASHFYGYERGTTVYTGRPTTWTGKVGLMYPSDYGYATSGGTTKDRAACLAKELYNWNSSDFSDCKNNDYLYKSDNAQWTLEPSGPDRVFDVNPDGRLVYPFAGIADYGVRPALFLKSNISIKSGTGESSNPYQLTY